MFFVLCVRACVLCLALPREHANRSLAANTSNCHFAHPLCVERASPRTCNVKHMSLIFNTDIYVYRPPPIHVYADKYARVRVCVDVCQHAPVLDSPHTLHNATKHNDLVVDGLIQLHTLTRTRGGLYMCAFVCVFAHVKTITQQSNEDTTFLCVHAYVFLFTK